MKKIVPLSLIAAALGLSAASLAQIAGPAGGPPKALPLTGADRLNFREMQKANQEILDKLNLTPDQKAKILAHQKEMALKRRELMKSASGVGQTPQTKEKAQALRKENQEFMKQALTPDQLNQYRLLMMERIRAMRARAGANLSKP